MMFTSNSVAEDERKIETMKKFIPDGEIRNRKSQWIYGSGLILIFFHRIVNTPPVSMPCICKPINPL